MNFSITIVIPVYNRADTIKATLASVADQTFRPLKVVLVDNNSSDGSLGVLHKWQAENMADDFSVEVISESTPGASAARNAGLHRVDTPWTMFFDSDDIMLPRHVAKVMEVIEKHPDVDVVGNKMTHRFINGTQRHIGFINSDTTYNNIHQSIFSTQLYCARTEVFLRAGGWDESLSMGDDVELGSRILGLQPKIRTISGSPTVIVNESGDSISNSHNRTFALIKALRKIQARLPERHRHWVDLQIIIQLAAFNKNDADAAGLATEIIGSTSPMLRRMVWKYLYRHTLRGRRGAARIYRLLSYFGI